MIPVGSIIYDRITGPAHEAMARGVVEAAATAETVRSHYDPEITRRANIFRTIDHPSVRRLSQLVTKRTEKVWGDELKVLSSWVNFYLEGNTFGLHSHPRSVVSCTYYPRGHGYFEYVDAAGEIIQQPTAPGDLIFFNSETVHDVGYAEPDRVCIAVTFVRKTAKPSKDID